MKTIILSLILLGFAGPAFALDRTDLDHRLQLLAAKFDDLQHKTDKCVPASLLARAKGIVLLDRTKAGFIFAYQGGNGVALVKDRHGNWSPAAFLSASEASLGFQIGGEQNFFVILFMTTNAVQDLAEGKIDFGGEAQGAAGDQSGGVSGSINSSEQAVVVYDDREGLFGGAAVKGGAISPDNNANEIYYGQFVTLGDILFDKKVKSSDTANALAEKIDTYSKP